MKTQCKANRLKFQPLCNRKIEADFSGGTISSDGGGLLLRECERKIQLTERVAACFQDFRNRDAVEHTVLDLVRQRVFALALGYEDLNDHETLRNDPLLAVLVGKTDPAGSDRPRERDKGHPLAAPSTLNRMEQSAVSGSADHRYKKLTVDFEAMDDLLIDLFLDQVKEEPDSLILDLDSTDIELHGNQEKKFYHGYYRHYCYLPLFVYSGAHLLAARLLPASVDTAKYAPEILGRIISRLRTKWTGLPVIVRGDSGFCRDQLMSWCEARSVHYLFGLAQNKRLKTEITEELAAAREEFLETKEAARRFKDFRYRTLDSWSRTRRVVGKAEHLAKGANPRFVVTSLFQEDFDAQTLYEQEYCARGEMENQLKQVQLDLFGDRLSSSDFKANKLRLFFAGFAFVLLETFRREVLQGTELANAYLGTIRLKLFKVAAIFKMSVRRVFFQLSSSFPYQELFMLAWRRLSRASP